MMIWVTDALTGNKVALNPDYIIAVFIAPDGEHKGSTAINLINGQIIVQETDLEIVASLKAN